MEQIVRQAREVGSSAGVLLPRSWLNKKVVVTLKDLGDEDIVREVVGVLLERGLLADVRGIYLTGSYARREQDAGSDIDVLVITGKTNKLISHKDYEIVLVPEKNFAANLARNLYGLVSVREARTLLNHELIDNYRKVKPNLDIKGLTTEIEGVLGVNEEAVSICSDSGKNVPDAIVYSAVLRLRELYLIRKLYGRSIRGELKEIVGERVYSAYLRVKRDKKEINDVAAGEILELIKLARKWLKEIKEF